MQKAKLQFKIQNYFFGIFLVFLLLPSMTSAAQLKLDSLVLEMAVGQQFQVELFLNTEEEDINAFGGQVVFPVSLLDLKEIRDGNSIVNFWIDRPKAENNVITFSGITPGGFNDEKGLIFSAIFEAKKEGEGVIEIRDARILKNDGVGTPAEVKISNFQFLISKQIPISQISKFQIKDIEPPESFVPEIAKDETLFDGKWFIVFATQDKASGIDHYEIKESRQIILSMFKKWASAESPYVLRDQELRSFVFVKAVDKAGNERIIKITPRNPLIWYENYGNWIMIIAGLFIIAFATRKLWKK